MEYVAAALRQSEASTVMLAPEALYHLEIIDIRSVALGRWPPSPRPAISIGGTGIEAGVASPRQAGDGTRSGLLGPCCQGSLIWEVGGQGSRQHPSGASVSPGYGRQR